MPDDLALVLGTWTAAMLRSATPLLCATLGETLTQRAGVINLGVEGEMLTGACVGFAVAAVTGDAWAGLAAGAMAGMALALVHAALVLGAGANQIASGLAVWMIALGATSYAGRAFVGGKVSPLPPLGDAATAAIPLLGPMLAQLTLAAPIAVAAAVAAGAWLFRTRTGLAWRTVGESAATARALGLSPNAVRLQAILVGGLFAGFGGAVLSIDYTQTWAQEMTKGRGLVAVGLVIVARWNPLLALPVCLVFGLTEAAVFRLQSSGVAFSSHLLATLPYLTALAVLVAAHGGRRRIERMPADLRAVSS